MYLDEHKKALFLVGMDENIEQLLQQTTNIPSKNMFIINSYGPVISHPYGDIMRDIIIAIYEENIEDIFVVGSTSNRENTINNEELLKKINKVNNIQSLDYLFQHCMPEFHSNSLKYWLEGEKSVKEGIQKSVDIIRRHPLLPSHVKVHGYVMDKNKGELVEVGVS